MTSNRALLVTFIILLSSILLFGITDLDLAIQDLFYNFTTNEWLLSSKTQPYKLLFYDGAKKILIAIGVFLLISLLLSPKVALFHRYKKRISLVVLSAIFIPLFIGLLKDNTNMPCPYQETHYNGLYPRTSIWETYPEGFTLKQTRCWPAGHASGGFALLSLFFLFKKKRNRYIGLAIGLSVGWIMGGYKMVIGDHFFSHTWITMILAWLIIIILARIIGVEKELHNG